MHCALLGVARLLLTLWTTSSKCHGTKYDLHLAIVQLDGRITKIQVLSEIRRFPRGIHEMKHWKGSYFIMGY